MPSPTLASEGLTEKLKAMSVSSLQEYPNCFPDVNPVDVYRAHLTSILTGITGVDAKIVYPALQWTQTLEKGDMVLPIPALRIKGKKTDELGTEWIQKVCLEVQLSRHYRAKLNCQ
jgi:arginyl-tRNA synthetase